jgi:predicted PurR-regulated permease PerM
VALVVAPLVELLDRWIPRALAILVILLVGVAGLGSLGVGLVLEVQDQLGQLGEQLPAAAAELEAGSGEDSVLARLRFGELVQDLVDRTSERIAPEPTLEDAAGTAPAYLVSGVLVVFFLVWGGALLAGLQRQIADPDRRRRLVRGADLAAHLTQRYVVTAAALGVAVAVVGGSMAWAADLPVPLTIGVLLGGASLVPYVGVLFGSVPVLLLSAGSRPGGTTLALALGLIALQAGSTVATRRLVERPSLRVGPAVIVVAAVVGSDLYGIGGALVAVLAGVLGAAAVVAWEQDQAGDDELAATSVDPAPG